MYRISFKILLVSFASLFLLIGCKDNSPYITNQYFPYGGDSSLVTTITSRQLPVPGVNGVSIPNYNLSCAYMAIRNGTSPVPFTTSLTGTLMNQIPGDIINIITLHNPPLSSLNPNDSIHGWLAQNVYFITSDDGSIVEITTTLGINIQQSLSGYLTYFPDGYYSYVSNISQTGNNMGIYQVSMSGAFPSGILYTSYSSGVQFNMPPLNPGPIQGYGIWGLQTNALFLLVQADGSHYLLIKYTPWGYLKK